MNRLITLIIAGFTLSGCAKWGDYHFESEKFDYKLSFPAGWEVWDRSDDRVDLLSATHPNLEEAKITVRAMPSAPDISPNEIYPSFMEGEGDQGILTEFRIVDRGTASCRNAEGRYIMVQHINPDNNISYQGLRYIFIGQSYILNIRMEARREDFQTREADFMKMISLLEL